MSGKRPAGLSPPSRSIGHTGGESGGHCCGAEKSDHPYNPDYPDTRVLGPATDSDNSGGNESDKIG